MILNIKKIINDGAITKGKTLEFVAKLANTRSSKRLKMRLKTIP